jgi:hypothetical protein
MAIKVRPFNKNAIVDVNVPKPVYVDSFGTAEENVSYFVTDQTYAPKRVTKAKHKEKTKKEVIEKPDTRVKNKDFYSTEDIYAPVLNVYVSNAMTDYAKAYLKMLLKLAEETFSEG